MARRRNIWQSGTLKQASMSSSRQSIRAVPDPVTEESASVRTVTPASPVAPSERDVRAKRPPLLSFLLRWETARRFVRVVVLMALDFAGVFLAIFTALLLKDIVNGQSRLISSSFHQTRGFVAFAYLVTLLLFARSDMYADRGERPGFTRILATLIQVMVVAVIFALVNGEKGLSSYYVFYGSFFFALIFLTALRAAYEQVSGLLLRAAGYRRRAVLVGTDAHIEAVAKAIAAGPHASVELVGFVCRSRSRYAGLRSLGTLAQIGKAIDENRVDEVIVVDPDFPEQELLELVDEAHRRGIRVRIAPSTTGVLIHRAEFVPGQSVPLFELRPPVFEGVDFVIKRTFDLLVATLLIVVLSPLLAVIALTIKLSSRGPVLYRSMRPGIGGVPFECLKFRTMVEGADRDQPGLEPHNEASGALFKMRRDPRLTRVGRGLRRFSLDELPQLFNVLRGQMSLVGPRPLPQRDFDRLQPWHMKRYLVMPGMTGLWQVSGRAELEFDDLVRLDFLYLERWSVFLDLAILFKTLPAVIWGRGAY
jgi:exopolysaccharide biosynthesis polyprenyl glycosylphosphotransferase